MNIDLHPGVAATARLLVEIQSIRTPHRHEALFCTSRCPEGMRQRILRHVERAYHQERVCAASADLPQAGDRALS